jgi:hypothetical protein
MSAFESKCWKSCDNVWELRPDERVYRIAQQVGDPGGALRRDRRQGGSFGPASLAQGCPLLGCHYATPSAVRVLRINVNLPDVELKEFDQDVSHRSSTPFAT